MEIPTGLKPYMFEPIIKKKHIKDRNVKNAPEVECSCTLCPNKSKSHCCKSDPDCNSLFVELLSLEDDYENEKQINCIMQLKSFV